MYKKIFQQAFVASVLAALAGIIYNRIYFFATETDYSRVLNWKSIIGISVLVCMVFSFIYYGLTRWLKTKGEIVFNFIFSILSFASIMVPLSISLPLEVKFPELFPGLAVPMVFFPALAWFTVRPLFRHQFH
ncbi:hypothetical protein [Flavihumibacter profundi]|jgi:hypothetical protein|uniref:hypothetical protein n=1 Tax=Flavihumibacter profundi TaxID=2716883 RepID=UPI001CC649C3|nr:hypothetical protein [Flavihumibacter profundi]MBZ5856613.1 hypothetical protein [Flavihumibacter profundi]